MLELWYCVMSSMSLYFKITFAVFLFDTFTSLSILSWLQLIGGFLLGSCFHSSLNVYLFFDWLPDMMNYYLITCWAVLCFYTNVLELCCRMWLCFLKAVWLFSVFSHMLSGSDKVLQTQPIIPTSKASLSILPSVPWVTSFHTPASGNTVLLKC